LLCLGQEVRPDEHTKKSYTEDSHVDLLIRAFRISEGPYPRALARSAES
jgi:hypothetical protein